MSSPLPKSLTGPPPAVPDTLVSFPSAHVLLVTLDRPRQLNAIPTTSHPLFDDLWRWYEAEPSLRCAVLTGTGRAFCAGADLKEWNTKNADAATSPTKPRRKWARAGFAGLSNRGGRKPVVAAVNGLCLGGGMEVALNCDVVLASADAVFGLPEVKRGVIALAGALPRLVRTVGKQRASEMALLGRHYDARTMHEWGIVNRVVPGGGDKVLAEALAWADEVAGNSPDSVLATREGLRLGWEPLGPEVSTEVVERGIYGRMEGAENMVEGVVSFVEKRKPVWRDSKL